MNQWQHDFPLIKNLSLDNKPYVYLDNASTTLKPQCVIDAVMHYYTHCGSNVHRGNYKASEHTTILYENSRAKIAQFINCKKHEVVFTRGTTDGINLITELLTLNKNDSVVNCIGDHHANFIPWDEKANLITVGLDESGHMNMTELEAVLESNDVKLLTVTHASNVSGNIQDIDSIIALAKQHNVKICLDSAQAIAHIPIDVSSLGVDFLVFSGHKLFGPSGSGVLYINESLHDDLPYARFGGGMVNVYHAERRLYKRIPHGLEPGTPAIEAVIGLGKAVDYLQSIGFKNISEHLSHWSETFLAHLKDSQYELAFPKNEPSLAVFTLKHKHHHHGFENIARMLSDTYNIAVGEGQQCCGPLYYANQLKAGMRISAQIYNDVEAVAYLFACLNELECFIGVMA